jgi:hypothetical protein
VFEALLRRGTTMGLRKGVGGSRAWLYVGILAVGLRALRHLANPEPEVLYRTKVSDTGTFAITTRRLPTRRERRAAGKAAKAAQ